MHVSRSLGFTLVELLVVIAIVAIMAAMVFPSFSGISESIHSAKCISNLRILSQAALQFASDNDNYLPPARWATGTNSSSLLDPYLTNAPTRFLCPSARAITNRAYGINAMLEQGIPPPWGVNDRTYWSYSACRILQLSKPSGIILFADSSLQSAGRGGSYVDGKTQIGIRHFGEKKFNASFVDGHAESLTTNSAQAAGFWTNGLPNM